MEVTECISTLSSIRSYSDKEVKKDIMLKVLEAGRLAPSAHNDQPWEFILINEKEILVQMSKYCISGRFIAEVAFAVVVLTDPDSKWKEIDTTRAAQNMVLTAWNFGLGSCWIGRIDTPGLKKYLNIPDKWDVLTVLPFGYFNEKLIPSAKYRKSPDQVFHLNQYGTKLDL